MQQSLHQAARALRPSGLPAESSGTSVPMHSVTLQQMHEAARVTVPVLQEQNAAQTMK